MSTLSTYNLEQTLDHCEVVLRSKIGAGQRLSKVYDSGRWLSNYQESAVLNAEAFNQQVFATLAATVFDDDGPRRRLEAAAAAFAYIRAMSSEWAEVQSPESVRGRHMVYKLYNGQSGLLYVGITDRGPVRLSEHYRHKPWFPQVVRVEFERYDTRHASAAREIELITNLRPLHNIQHNRGR